MINLTLLTDFYELTMANGYFVHGMAEKTAYFDLFFRKVPDGGGFAIAAGLEQVIDYLEDLTFTDEDIAWLREKGIFDEGFLEYLRTFEFSCDVWAVPEGTPVFPNEPILTVRGPVIQAQFIETMLLLLMNHQSLIATKANRIVRAAAGRAVMEFGSRRAQGSDGALLGARAAYIGGCMGSANTLADRVFGIPAIGTMAHSWVQMFPTEYDAFKAYATTYPDRCTLLVDTYNTLESGVPNAIRVFNDILAPRGCRPAGIRIDSGDLTYLSREARRMLDEAGYPDCKIVASNALDENIIREIILQGGAIDLFGVGERLITSKSDPVFGGVYKLVAVEEEGRIIPKIKISENVEKIINPGFKEVWRLYDRKTGKAMADVLTAHGETIDDGVPYELFDPEHTWKRKTLKEFQAKRLMVPVFEKGKCIMSRRTVDEIRDHCKAHVDNLWDEVKRFEYPHKYYVDLSNALWTCKRQLLEAHGMIGTAVTECAFPKNE